MRLAKNSMVDLTLNRGPPSSWSPPQSTIVSEGFKGGTRGAPIMPRDAVSRTAHVGTQLRKRNGMVCNCCRGHWMYTLVILDKVD